MEDIPGPSDEELATILRVAKRTVASRGAQQDRADEVAQQVAVKLWSKWRMDHIQRARSRGDLGWHRYVAAAARNAERDLLRAERRREERQRRSMSFHPSSLSQRPGVLQARATDAAEVELFLARQQIRTEIDRLTGRRRQVAVRMLLFEMSVAETAEALGIKPRTVRQHLLDGRDELARRIRQNDDDW